MPILGSEQEDREVAERLLLAVREGRRKFQMPSYNLRDFSLQETHDRIDDEIGGCAMGPLGGLEIDDGDFKPEDFPELEDVLYPFDAVYHRIDRDGTEWTSTASTRHWEARSRVKSTEGMDGHAAEREGEADEPNSDEAGPAAVDADEPAERPATPAEVPAFDPCAYLRRSDLTPGELELVAKSFQRRRMAALDVLLHDTQISVAFEAHRAAQIERRLIDDWVAREHEVFKAVEAAEDAAAAVQLATEARKAAKAEAEAAEEDDVEVEDETDEVAEADEPEGVA